VDAFSKATITKVAFISNQAQGGAGGAGADGGKGGKGGNGWGGGLSVGARRKFRDAPDGTSVSLRDATIAANQAIGGTGGIGGDGGNGSGGGVFIGATVGSITPSLAVSDTNITANSADGGDGGAGGSTGDGVGGGVYNLGDFIPLDTVIAGNRASTSNDNIFPS
jgi:hypothetical protein